MKAIEDSPHNATNLSGQIARVEVRKNALAVWRKRAGPDPVEDDADKDVLERLSDGHPMSQIDELLPWKWASLKIAA